MLKPVALRISSGAIFVAALLLAAGRVRASCWVSPEYVRLSKLAEATCWHPLPISPTCVAPGTCGEAALGWVLLSMIAALGLGAHVWHGWGVRGHRRRSEPAA